MNLPFEGSWYVRAQEISPYDYGWGVTAYAICANVTTTTVAAAATPTPPAAGDPTNPPVTVTEPTTTTVGAQTLFLPVVTQ